MSPAAWTRWHRLMCTVPIFIILIGLLVFVSNATAMPWNYEPTADFVDTVRRYTGVTFDNPGGVHLAKCGEYEVSERSVWFDAKRPSTGEIQRTHVIIREPVGVSGKLPGMVFMHGAGYGSAVDSFGDMAYDLSSAGFVTAVLDKPVWSTNDIKRDYPGSAAVYDEVINLLRKMDNVDASKVGIYATSESTWISSYLLTADQDIAFQVLLSPMVFTPRYSMGFLAAQDFALVGAHDGYQSIVRRVFNIDSALFGVTLPRHPHVDAERVFDSDVGGVWLEGRDDRAGGRRGENRRSGSPGRQHGTSPYARTPWPTMCSGSATKPNPEPRSPTRTWTMWSTGPSAPRTDWTRPANAWPAPECTSQSQCRRTSKPIAA